jgi:hypothetical protein
MPPNKADDNIDKNIGPGIANDYKLNISKILLSFNI